MCQPRRAPKSPADTQAEANQRVEQIAAAAYTAFVENLPWEPPSFEEQDPGLCEMYRHMVRRLIMDGVIRPGFHPLPEIVMEGQLTIDD